MVCYFFYYLYIIKLIKNKTKLNIMENLNTEKIATFQLNNEFVTIKLDQIHLMMLESEGLKSLIHRLRGDVWVSLKLRGEKLTIRELKFKGIE